MFPKCFANNLPAEVKIAADCAIGKTSFSKYIALGMAFVKGVDCAAVNINLLSKNHLKYMFLQA